MKLTSVHVSTSYSCPHGPESTLDTLLVLLRFTHCLLVGMTAIHFCTALNECYKIAWKILIVYLCLANMWHIVMKLTWQHCHVHCLHGLALLLCLSYCLYPRPVTLWIYPIWIYLSMLNILFITYTWRFSSSNWFVWNYTVTVWHNWEHLILSDNNSIVHIT